MKCLDEDEDEDKNKARSETGILGERIRNNACQVVLLTPSLNWIILWASAPSYLFSYLILPDCLCACLSVGYLSFYTDE